MLQKKPFPWAINSFTKQSLVFTTLEKKAFENIEGNVTMLDTFPEFSIFYSNLFCRLQTLSIWTSLKVCGL